MNRAALILAIAAVSAVAGCSRYLPPPPLSDDDLQAVIVAGWLGQDRRELHVVLSKDPCIRLHDPAISLTDDANHLSKLQVTALRLGLRAGLKNRTKPGAENEAVEPTVEGALNRASAVALLKVSKTARQRPKAAPWLVSCKVRTWFSAPIYVGQFAVVDQGRTCGNLCGAGSTMALEYCDRRWRVIGVRSTWMA